MKRIAAWFMSALLLALSLTGCSAGKTETENRGKSYFTYFDTVSFVYSYAGDSAEQFDRRSAGASGILGEYHRLFDIYHEYSGENNLCTLNRNAGGESIEVDRKLIDFLVYAKELYETTDGKMNVMMGSVLSIWHDLRTAAGDDPASARIPTDEELQTAGEHTDISALEIDEENCTVRISDPDASIDVGALGKGAPYRECLTHGWTVDGEGKAMHKSLGNGMDPAEIINEFGADMLRLWAGSADYHADMRCSKEIFKQLTQNYLKFRNTARYCLGNLDGFDAEHLVAPEDMLPLDRWAITKLNDLIRRVAKAYDNYEFHVVSHAINDFCVVELSSFYLDIIKDRLYCEERNGLKRRSAQTALFLILDSMTKMFAPILAFTCDEIWLAMPHRAEDDARNVLLNVMNQPFDAYALSESELARWDQLIRVRSDVNGVLEAARAEKRIGKPQDAEVIIYAKADSDEMKLFESFGNELADIFICSGVELSSDAPADGSFTETVSGIAVKVFTADGTKCDRCWFIRKDTCEDGEGGHLCKRCASIVSVEFPEL